jgi:hypothetical protein
MKAELRREISHAKADQAAAEKELQSFMQAIQDLRRLDPAGTRVGRVLKAP